MVRSSTIGFGSPWFKHWLWPFIYFLFSHPNGAMVIIIRSLKMEFRCESVVKQMRAARSNLELKHKHGSWTRKD
jgi:hypothetical protein